MKISLYYIEACELFICKIHICIPEPLNKEYYYYLFKDRNSVNVNDGLQLLPLQRIGVNTCKQ